MPLQTACFQFHLQPRYDDYVMQANRLHVNVHFESGDRSFVPNNAVRNNNKHKNKLNGTNNNGAKVCINIAHACFYFGGWRWIEEESETIIIVHIKHCNLMVHCVVFPEYRSMISGKVFVGFFPSSSSFSVGRLIDWHGMQSIQWAASIVYDSQLLLDGKTQRNKKMTVRCFELFK